MGITFFKALLAGAYLNKLTLLLDLTTLARTKPQPAGKGKREGPTVEGGFREAFYGSVKEPLPLFCYGKKPHLLCLLYGAQLCPGEA